MPQWLKYELSYKLPICKIRFSPRSNDEDGNTLSDCPKKYKIKGSNDNENFDELLSNNILVVFTLVLFVGSFQFGFGPMRYTLLGELFEPREQVAELFS